MPSAKLEPFTWIHFKFDDAAEAIEASGPSAETPLQKRAAVRRAREDLSIVEGTMTSRSFGAPSMETFIQQCRCLNSTEIFHVGRDDAEAGKPEKRLIRLASVRTYAHILLRSTCVFA